MYAQDKITDFILLLLTQTDDEDIKTFLECSSKKLSYLDDENLSLDKCKPLLIRHLFSSAYSYIESHVPEILDVVTNWDRKVEEEVTWYHGLERYKPLYLNLYALCQCFYSYIILDSESAKTTMEIAKIFSNEFNLPTLDISSFKKNSTKKLLKLLINSYKENGFYYCFNKNSLVKIKIRQTTKEYYSNQFDDYCKTTTVTYQYTKFELVDIEEKTFIVNERLGIKEALGKKLIRTQSVKKHDIEGYFKEFFKSTDFDTAKYFHKKIVSILKQSKDNDAVVCSKNKIDKLQEKYDNLLQKLKEIQKAINPEEPIKKLKDFKYINFDEELFSENFHDGLTFGQLKVNHKTYLEKKILNLKKSIQKTDDSIYNPIIKLIAEVEPLISKILDM